MTAYYGKLNDNLIAIGTKISELEKYEYNVIWNIDETNIYQVISMLIDCVTLGISQWRILQLYQFYNITENHLIQLAKDFGIKIEKINDNSFRLSGIKKDHTRINEESTDLLTGIVQIFISAEIDIRSRNKGSKNQ